MTGLASEARPLRFAASANAESAVISSTVGGPSLNQSLSDRRAVALGPRPAATLTVIATVLALQLASIFALR